MQNMQKQAKYADIHADFARKKLIDCRQSVAALLTADVVTSTHEQRPACPGCSIEAERKIQICIVK